MLEILDKFDSRGNAQIDPGQLCDQRLQVNNVGKLTLFKLQFETTTPIK